MKNLFMEGENSATLLNGLQELEDGMNRKSIFDRVIGDIQKSELGDVEIIPLNTQYIDAYKHLVLHGLIENLGMEVEDEDIINDPMKRIDNNGAFILMAKIKDTVIGTIVLVLNENKNAEIIYLVVEEKWQKRHVGRKLLLDALDLLRKNNLKHVLAHIHRRHTHAIRLFKECGFSLHDSPSG